MKKIKKENKENKDKKKIKEEIEDGNNDGNNDEDNDEDNNLILASRKIRIFPSKEQINYFNKCFGTTRYIYNRTLFCYKYLRQTELDKYKKMKEKGCVHMVLSNSPRIKGSKTSKKVNIRNQCCGKLETKFFCSKHSKQKIKYRVPLNYKYWYHIIMAKNNNLNDNDKWLSEIPFDTRAIVIKRLLANIKAAITNLKRRNIKKFDIKFRSKKDKNQYFYIDYRAIDKKMILWPSKFDHPLSMRNDDKNWFMDQIDNLKQMIITREFPGKYFLHVPYEKDKIEIKNKKEVISIDPGIRSFHAFYDPEGTYGEIGNGLADRILGIHKKIDRYQSIIDTICSNKKNISKKKNCK